MKRYLLFFLTGATLLWTTSHAAGPAGSLGYLDGDNNNPHNLSSLALTNHIPSNYEALTETQICVFCHTPHNATPLTTLWSRPDPDGPIGGFPIRANLKISDPVVGGVLTTHYGDTTNGFEYPNGSSKLCLSCHDGVTAMGILTNSDIIDMTDPPTFSANFAIDLSTSHPISFIYTSDVVNHLNPLSYKLPAAGYLDIDDRVQCTSCHQPHQDTQATGGTYPFWRVGNGDPADYNTVCGQCHIASPPSYTEHAYP